MNVHGRERKRAGNNGVFSYSKANDIFRRNPNPPPNSSPSTLKSPDQNKLCKYWMAGHCHRGDKCWYLHSWSLGDGFTMLAKLEGHKKTIRGIALPSGHDKLYSGSSDGTARIWDGHTGKCLHFTNLGDEAGSLITEGAWVFIGMKNVVKALNIHSDLELNLKGPVGQVYAMIVAGDMLFAGAQNGGIIAWRASFETDSFQLAASLEGHNGAVSCLAVGDKMLFSGSLDKTIRVWDIDTFQCIKTFSGHADVVTSLVHCNGYLFSSSLDCTIKVLFATEGQNWVVLYTHKEENGVLAHRKCVQHWCNEKGDIICEICHQSYQPDYTAPPRPPTDETAIDIGGGWTISGTPLDLRDPRLLAIAEAERQFLETGYDEYAASNATGAAFCRSAAVILMALLLLRHAVTVPDADSDDDVSSFFSFFLLRAAGFLLPCYIMAWAISILQQRRQRQQRWLPPKLLLYYNLGKVGVCISQ